MLLGSTVPLVPAKAQEEVPSSTPTVNIEFILDASGSMAAITDTGETRMDAAKRVLREVIGSIPDRDGSVNVGFRIYGHKGDNSEATKAISCKASSLLVPIAGVDQGALMSAIDSAQPTGWTPLALSINRAGRDFDSSGEGVVNAAVLLTDGIETCDGDPVAEAERFRKRKDSQMITHVVGFGTTPEEQQILGGIAEKGDGLLLGAGNAAELRTALFSVLEELKIVVGVGYVGGNAFGLIPPGDAGQLSIVARGAMDEIGNLPIVARNNTGNDVVGLKVSATVRDAGGNLLGAQDANTIQPFFVRSGGIAISNLFFSPGTVFPVDAQYEFKVSSMDIADARFYSHADLDIVEASLFDNRIVGTMRNGYEKAVDGPFYLLAACFDEAGNLLSVLSGNSDSPSLAPGEEQSFEVDLFLLTYFSDLGCPTFLVTGQGYGTPTLPVVSTAPKVSATVGEDDPVATTTPESSGSAVDSEFFVPGMKDIALRSFESVPSATDGILGLSAVVAEFSSADAADAGVDLIVDRYIDLRAERGDATVTMSEPKRVSAPKLGDRRVALAWTFTSSGIELPAAVLGVQLNTRVYFFMIVGRNINPMEELAVVAESILGEAPRQGIGDGVKSGGLWDLLPTLDEVPFGLSVASEKVPEDWGPVPAPDVVAAAPHQFAT